MFFSKLLIILFVISTIFCLPVMRMRLCINSNEPFRLQSQCVYCNNKRFQSTVLQCTNENYLPANITLEEGICMITNCRKQVPFLKPQFPFTGHKNYPNVNVFNTEPLVAGNDYNFYQNINPTPRPPAVIQIGKPIRTGLFSLRPGIFGK